MAKVTLDMETFKALASPTRLNVLRALDERRKTLTELSTELELNKATVHEHMAVLVAAGLADKQDEGRKWIYYALTWQGKKLLHPGDNTSFMVMLGLGVASAGGGVFLLGKALDLWWQGHKPTLDDGGAQPGAGQAENGDGSTGVKFFVSNPEADTSVEAMSHPQASGEPNGDPSADPSGEPNGDPSADPSGEPGEPGADPSGEPGEPSGEPSGQSSTDPMAEDGSPYAYYDDYGAEAPLDPGLNATSSHTPENALPDMSSDETSDFDSDGWLGLLFVLTAIVLTITAVLLRKRK